MIFKTKTIEELYDEANDIPVDKKKTQKDIGAISLADILEKGHDKGESIEDVAEDIINNKIKVNIDEKSIEILKAIDPKATKDDSSQDGATIDLLDRISKGTKKLDIDISSMSQLDMKTLEKIESYCSIGKVYLNNGWDETAKQGNTVSRYKASLKKAKEMLEAAGVEDGQESQVKFDKIYKYVVEHAKYDYNGQGDNNHTSRGLEGFFIKNEPTGVCAGLTLGTMCLCQMAGIEDVEYVNGKGKMPGRNKEEMHSWFRVKIDGEWTNCDISWDLANRNSKLNDFVFKQISDERFYKGGMHKADLKYNPTYIRSRDVRYQDYDEERSYEESTTSHNSLTDKEIKDLFFTEREIDIVRNTGINWFKGLKSGLANAAVVVLGTNIGGKRFNEFLLANNTLGDDEVKTELHKRKTFLKKQQERKEEKKEKKDAEKQEKRAQKEVKEEAKRAQKEVKEEVKRARKEAKEEAKKARKDYDRSKRAKTTDDPDKSVDKKQDKFREDLHYDGPQRPVKENDNQDPTQGNNEPQKTFEDLSDDDILNQFNIPIPSPEPQKPPKPDDFLNQFAVPNSNDQDDNKGQTNQDDQDPSDSL